MSGKIAVGPALLARCLEQGWAPLPAEDLERTCQAILRLTPQQRELWVRNSRRAGHPQVLLHLVATSYELRLTDPPEALRLAKAAADATSAMALGAESALTNDLRAHAWGNLANCYRLLGQFGEADRAWAAVESFREAGSGGRHLAAELLRKRGILRVDQRRFCDALDLQSEAASLGEAERDLHFAAKVRLEIAVTHFYAGQIDQALEIMPLAAQHLDVRAQPEMGFAYIHNLLFFLEAAGDFPCALRLSLRAERQYQELASPLVLLRGWWLRGRLLLGVEDWRGARPFLELARRGFLERQLLYDAALAGFDLALAWTHQNERFRVQRLACEMFEVFRSQQIPREAAAALQLFAEAAKVWKADLALMRRVAADLEPLRRPGLPAQTEAP